ncbi:hypothetical protein G3480_16965 [Thiorhodococcus mannitoliphagus]|uniref:HEAT repeat domain-containing protein n=1 Tax=Thiorhodococcus mannitoliphagus TaxID=329406 RepID=A0A6P1E1U8_9GAMM|nr:hypothetical protein [Thiorhodococcus mannitoliphagus]NEX21974.1 hypothetical protein [Thiorhodococcus mannitoliphagus]
MPNRKDKIEARLTGLRSALETAAPDALQETLTDALRDPHCRILTLAAEAVAERLLYALECKLILAFERLAELPPTKDPQCMAKSALARALVTLDCSDVGFYLRGMHLRQLEPVWGGSLDTAVDIRLSCAAGLVATSFARALPELALLLGDAEPQVRSGVTAAIACAEPIAAEAVLRAKAVAGDAEPEVTGACLSALLQVAPETSVDFVDRFLNTVGTAEHELAALALGESRLDRALDALKARWDSALYKGAAEQHLLRGAVLHRSQAAFDWLVSIIAEGEPRHAESLVRDLAIYRSNERLLTQVRATVSNRADKDLAAAFERYWIGSRH